jgi:hypothetical protein
MVINASRPSSEQLRGLVENKHSYAAYPGDFLK